MGGGHTHTAEETAPGGPNPAWLAREDIVLAQARI